MWATGQVLTQSESLLDWQDIYPLVAGAFSVWTSKHALCPAGLVHAQMRLQQTELRYSCLSSERVRVLYLVEDRCCMELVREALRSYALIELSLATSTEEGLRAEARQPHDIVILDSANSLGAGRSFLQLIGNRQGKSHYQICISGNSLVHAVKEVLSDGIDEYWVKPIHVNFLVERILDFAARLLIKRRSLEGH